MQIGGMPHSVLIILTPDGALVVGVALVVGGLLLIVAVGVLVAGGKLVVTSGVVVTGGLLVVMGMLLVVTGVLVVFSTGVPPPQPASTSATVITPVIKAILDVVFNLISSNINPYEFK